MLVPPRHSCPPITRLEGWRVLVARILCLQVAHKPEVRRLFPPSFFWQSLIALAWQTDRWQH